MAAGAPAWERLFSTGEYWMILTALDGRSTADAAPLLKDLIADLRTYLKASPDEWDELPLANDAAEHFLGAVEDALAMCGRCAALHIGEPWLEFMATRAEVHRERTRDRHRAGQRNSAEGRRELAQSDPAYGYLAAAYEQLTKENGRAPGRTKLLERARQLAASAGKPSEKITDHKAKRFISGD